MSTDTDCDLTDKQQLLLSRYFDGECGFISRIAAKRLIASNRSALLFLNSLQRNGETLRSNVDDARSEPVDLWSRIDARIEQEERASFYLGERRVQTTQTSLFGNAQPSHLVFGGLSGAALAAAALFMVYQPASLPNFSSPQTVALNAPQAFQPVALGNSGRPLRPTALAPSGTRGMEVDWMRSNGSLSLIPDPNGSSTIIWVRRKSLRTLDATNSSRLQPTPLGRVEPTATFAAQQEWLDGSTTTGSK
jgi:hypothetical protein